MISIRQRWSEREEEVQGKWHSKILGGHDYITVISYKSHGFILLLEESCVQDQELLPSLSYSPHEVGDWMGFTFGRPYKYDSSQTEYFVETEAKVTIRKKEAHRHVPTQEAVAGQDCMMGDPFSLSIRNPSVASVRGRISSLRPGYRRRALPGRLRLRLWT